MNRKGESEINHKLRYFDISIITREVTSLSKNLPGLFSLGSSLDCIMEPGTVSVECVIKQLLNYAQH